MFELSHFRTFAILLAMGALGACATEADEAPVEDCGDACDFEIPVSQVHEFGSFGACQLNSDHAVLFCRGQYSEAANFSISYWNIEVEVSPGVKSDPRTALSPQAAGGVTFDLAALGWVPGEPIQVRNTLSLSQNFVPIGEIEQALVLDSSAVPVSDDGTHLFEFETGYEAWDVYLYGDFEATWGDVRESGQWLMLEFTHASIEEDPLVFGNNVFVGSDQMIYMPMLAARGVQPKIDQLVLTTNLDGASGDILPLDVSLESPGTYFFDAKQGSMRLATNYDFVVGGL